MDAYKLFAPSGLGGWHRLTARALLMGRITLLTRFRSLFFEKASLLFFLGNLTKSRCGTAAFG